MKPIFESKHFKLQDVKRSGKKQIAGNMVLQGIDSGSGIGSGQTVLAAASGTVISTEHSMQHERDKRYGKFIKLLTDDTVDPCVIIYYELTVSFADVGEHITIGDRIAYVANRMVHIECRRNGRLIDASAELGIPPIIDREWGGK